MKPNMIFPLLALLIGGCTTLPIKTSEEARQWLNAHNSYRRLHGAPDVVWSNKLAAGAQAVADSCPKGHSKTPYGENIAWVSVIKPPAEIVKFWYDEEPMYNYDKPGYAFRTGHFTQLVWKDSKEIGCGRATGCNTRIANVWVCHYNPPGNYRGRFADKVSPPSN